MKYYKYILVCILLLSGEYLFAQKNQRDIEILFSIQESDLNINTDTLHFLKNEQVSLYFFDNKIYNNKKKIYAFKDVEYYMELMFIKRNGNHYLYMYPKYQNRTGPYIWYGLGILFEVTEEEIITKSNYDYYDMSDIDLLFDYKEFKISRRVKIKKYY